MKNIINLVRENILINKGKKYRNIYIAKNKDILGKQI